MPFFKEILEETRKELIKSLVKYALSGLGCILLFWIGSKSGLIKDFFETNIQLTYYTVIIIGFILIMLSSCITFILFNLKYQKLKRDSMIDQLTGLLNEKGLNVNLNEAIRDAKKDKTYLSLILIDIDNFKKINDDYSSADGDLVMKQLGYILSNDKKLSDIPCRQHNKGDEFIIIAKGTSGINARTAAEIKRKLISEFPFQIKNNKLANITVSCGVVEFDLKNDDNESVLHKADIAKLKAKENGKSCTILYEM